MGGGASSQGKSQPPLSKDVKKQSIHTNDLVSVDGPSPRRSGKSVSHKQSPRGSLRVSSLNECEESASNNQAESPVADHRHFSRKSSESSMHEDHSDGVNDENMDYLAFSAMSLGMDNEELLFNMFYFGDDGGGGFRQSMNTAIEETYAAHSTGNTPYKLRPATESSIRKHLTSNINLTEVGETEECLICQERLRDQGLMAMITACQHVFHEECVLRWFTLQNWCPICRAVLDADALEHQVKTDRPNSSEHNCAVGRSVCNVNTSDWCGSAPRSLDNAMTLAADV